MMYYTEQATPRIRSLKVPINRRKAIALTCSLAFAVSLSFSAGAQAMDQAAIAQALATQGASGGTAPTIAPTLPTVNALASPGAPAVTAPIDTSRSPLESMFAGMATGLGTPTQNLEQFGYSLFEKPTAPSLASIGDDYVLGPGDSLVLYLWGDPVDIKEISASYTLSVDRNGYIFLPPAGQIAVWSQDLATVRTVIKSMLDRRYKKLEMSLTLATLRQFPVFVSGYAGNPGTVLASGADTILTVLSRAGGIKKTGSLRKVVLTRQTKGVSEKLEIDFYDSLMKGLPIDLRIREGDSLFVPGIGPVAALAGELKRPGIYELKGDTSIATALGLAGGALPSARSGGVTLLRFSESGKSLVSGDLSNASFSSKLASDGDFVYFGKVTELLVGQAQVSGPAKYSGRYEIASVKSLGALLKQAQLLPETNLFYGRVYRMDLSGRDKSFAFSPRDVLAGVVAGSGDIPLAEFDRVVLYRYDDVGLDPDFDRFADTLVVSGPVKYPGFYLYKEGSTLSGLLSNNALTLDANPFYGEIIRKSASGAEEYFTFSPREILSGVKDFTLSRLDRVRFVKRGTDVTAHDFDKFPDAVQLTGQVSRPEVYALGSGLKLSKILTNDQALLDTNLNYAEITRLKADGKNEYVTFRPSEVLDGSWDFDLGARDVVKLLKVGYAPAKPDFDRFSAAVQVTGPVQFGGLYAWRENMKLSSLLAKAKPSLVINQVYAEIVRPLGGDKFEYLTFSPKEVAAGIFDLSLKARDSVRFYTTVPAAPLKQGVEVPAAVPAPAKLGADSASTEAVSTETTPVGPEGPVILSSPAQSTPAAPAEATPVQSPGSAPVAAPAGMPSALSIESSADLGMFLEVVTVSGAVRYTGPWARTPTLKLSSVISADQMLEETNLDYAELIRLKADGSSEYRTFAPREVLEGKFDLALRAKDSIRLVKKTTFGGTLAAANIEKFADLVQLTGQAARPELFALLPGMKLSKILTKDQVLLDTNLNYAEITRLKTDGKNEYVTFKPSEVLNGSWDFDLGARDVVKLLKVGYAPEKPDFDRFSAAVQVTGPVQFGGLYAWREDMKLSGLLGLAKPSLAANQVYAEIVRPLGGDKFEYLTFSPKEVAAGIFDLSLKAKDSVHLYATVRVTPSKLGAEAPIATVTNASVPATESGTAAPPLATAILPDATPSVAAPIAPIGTTGEAIANESPTDLGRFLEVVTVSGAVRYTGPWARTPSLTLASVITPDQMLEETNLDYAELTRLKADGSGEYRTFAPRDVLEGKFDLALRAKDSIRLVKKTTFGGTLAAADIEKFADIVQLTGQAARPEVFALRPGMKLSMLLTKDQALLDTNLNYAEITRLKADGKNEYVTFKPSEVLDGSWDIDLGARDVVKLLKVGYAPEKPDFDRFYAAVQVTGPVQFGGLYAWREDMKLSSLLAKAKPSLVINQVYAEIVRPLGGDKFEYLTFSPKEVAAGIFDLSLKARDSVRFYTTVPAVPAKQGVETASTEAVSTETTPVGPEGPVILSSPAQSTPAAPAEAPPVQLSESPTESPADLGRFLEVVTVSGAVRYSGPWARTPTLKLSSVITADQMLEETNLDYAELTRLKADGSGEYTTFAPRDVLEGKFDLALRARDSIRLVKKTAFGGALAAADVEKFADIVQLTGQAARPELYAFVPGMKLSRIVTSDQILLGTNLYYAELVRVKTNGRDEYVTFKPSEVLSGAWDLELSPRDLVILHKVNYSPEKPDFDRFADSVLMSGPLRFSGLYAWRSGAKLSELQGAAQPLLDVNQVYADILRVLPDGKSQLITFAPREVASGTFDTEISARDTVRYYSITQAAPKIAIAEPQTEAGQAVSALVATGSINVGAAAEAAGPASGITTDAGFFLEVVNTLGQIRYVGPYARTPTLKLSSVVTADQILQDTNLDYAELTRRKSDGGWEYATFSPREVLSGSYDLPLRAQDAIRYFKVGYLPEKPDFDHFGNAYALAGHARNSGLYSINAPALLSDIITPSRLLSDTDIYYAEIDRWVTGGRIEYLTFSPLAVISGLVDMRVFPRDIVRLVPAGDKGETHDFSKYADTVLLQGTIRYPGRYAWYKGFSLSAMLSDTDLLIDTDSSYAVIKRKSSEKESLIGFSPAEIVRGDKDMELQPRDTVMFFPKYTNRPVTISGEIVEPKVIPYYEGIELSVVLRSVALSADISSLKAVVTKAAGGSVEIYLEEYLHRQASTKVPLQPGDSISIKKLLPDEHLSIVMVRGAVKNPQPVEFREGMRLAEALEAAGGFQSRAYPAGLVLIRKNAAELQQKQVDRLIAQLEAMSAAGGSLPTSTDSTLSSAAAIIANLQIDYAMQRAKLGALRQQYKEGFGRISLDIPETLAELGVSSSNVVLERDDLIFVPTTPTYILVSGEVSDQTVIAYRSGITVRQALSESGWISRDADLPRIYIIRVNGKLDSATGKGFLFFRPNILKYTLNPGDTIIVPAKTVKVSVAWSYIKDSFSVISTILTTALTTKTLLGL